MGYDRIWIKRIDNGREWVERSQAERSNWIDEFNAQALCLHRQGHYVTLTAGKNYCFDELFLFTDESEAQGFFDKGFRDWESFPEDGDEGCGFQEISLYLSKRLSATKTAAPSTRQVMPDDVERAEEEVNDGTL